MSQMIGKKRRQYNSATLDHAVEQVKMNAISLCRASKEYGIPKTTLHDKIKDKYPSSRIGPKPVLTEVEENRIESWAIHMSRIGYGRTRQELADVVKKILDADGRKTPFTNNKPGKDWLTAFFKRHPNLTLRTTLQLGKERAVISPEKVKGWFTNFVKYIEEEVKDAAILRDPSRLYNADESGFSLCASTGKVIGCKGAPVVYHYGNSCKLQLTVMAAASANGHYIPPMIVYPGQRFSYNPLEGFEDAAMGCTESGWMDSELFCEWLQTVFVPSIEARGVQKPVVLLLDGHSTHVSLEASDICLKNGVELYCLLEHASHVMQPLDLRLFASLKNTWKQAVREYQSDHIGELVTKRTFARVFWVAWENSATLNAAIKGFYAAGLFPIGPERVMQSVKLEPSKIFSELVATETSTNDVDGNSENDRIHSVESASITQDRSPTWINEPMVLSPAEVDSVPIEQQNKDAYPENANTNQLHQEASNQTHLVEMSSAQSPPKIFSANNSIAETVMDAIIPSPVSENSQTKAPLSPFSKFLKCPHIVPKSNKAKRPSMPKAITGSAYRLLLQEKREKKEQEEQAKIKRKEERLKKKLEKENQIKLKKMHKQQKQAEKRQG